MRLSSSRVTTEKGFTVVELLIATVVFSVVLVVITSGIIHFTADYYKSVRTSSTQTAARNLTDLIAQNFQYGGGKGDYKYSTNLDGSRSGDQYICIGNTQINYRLGAQLGVDSAGYGVFVSTKAAEADCNVYNVGLEGRELLGKNMRLTNLKIEPPNIAGATTYRISAGVAYGDLDLLCASALPATSDGSCSSTKDLPGSFDWYTTGESVRCKSGAGSQFCAFSHLTTQVTRRFEGE